VSRARGRFLIQILPAAVVAPLYFRGQIGFGVINQSSSAFNHILSDVSLVVYQARATGAPTCNGRVAAWTMSYIDAVPHAGAVRVGRTHAQGCFCCGDWCPTEALCSGLVQFESLAGFSAVIDRLGEFSEVVGSYTPAEPAAAEASAADAPGARTAFAFKQHLPLLLHLHEALG
jgi:hypothetical protein